MIHWKIIGLKPSSFMFSGPISCLSIKERVNPPGYDCSLLRVQDKNDDDIVVPPKQGPPKQGQEVRLTLYYDADTEHCK
jgi:hypothetical protein